MPLHNRSPLWVVRGAACFYVASFEPYEKLESMSQGHLTDRFYARERHRAGKIYSKRLSFSDGR